MTDPRNPNFARATANRVWALLFGRPLVEPIDDLPAHGELAARPEDSWPTTSPSHGFDLRRLIRAIAATEAFALDSATEDDDGPTSTLEAAWAAFPITRLRPEQVAGALLQAASAETIDADSHILVRLATYGGRQRVRRPPRRPRRGRVRPEGSSTIPQRLLMMNGDLVQKKTGRTSATPPPGSPSSPPTTARPSRPPTSPPSPDAPPPKRPPTSGARLAGTRGDERKQRMTDLIWALLNSTEFSWDH